MKVLFSHPTGNANMRGVLTGLQNHGMLHSFHTSVACFKGSLLDKMASVSFLKEFKKRSFPNSVQDKTHTYPYKELGRMVSQKLKIKSYLTHETGRFSVGKCCAYIDKKVADFVTRRNDIDVVYCFEDTTEQTFIAAKNKGIKRAYDLPIGYWREMHRLLSAETEKYPEWAVTMGGFKDSEEKLKRKERELALADVIYVASSFTKKTLEAYPGTLAPVHVVPYGFPEVNTARVYEPLQGRKLKLLYVGGLTQRKGIANVFEAMKGLEDRVELTVVGKGNIDECPALKQALTTCNYIPSLPHADILKLMATQDVFVFPSLFEGFGLVITEAMSQGTPAITTDRTCGPDVITHGVDGWLIEAGSTAAIKQSIESILQNPEILIAAGKAAMKTAMNRPWSKYGDEMAAAINKFS